MELLERFPADGAELIRRVKDREHEGDRLTHDVVDLLNRTFVTPFERDDIYRLASAIDDVCDHVDEAADNIALYGVRVVPPEAKAQADVILRPASSGRARIRSRSSAGRTSTSSSKARSTHARTPPTCSRRSS